MMTIRACGVACFQVGALEEEEECHEYIVVDSNV